MNIYGERVAMIEQDDFETLVIFRKYKDTKQILALFPEIEENRGLCSCYQHIGQHGSADYMHCVHNLTTWAKPEEYADLKSELEQIGYKLKVRRKWMRK